MKNPLWFIIWLLILVFITFFIAAFCAGWYILIYPLTICIPPLTGLSDILLQGAQLPHYAAQSMVECRPLF